MIAARDLSLSTGLANPIFNNENAAHAHFEAIRWPETKPVLTINLFRLACSRESGAMLPPMRDMLKLIGWAVAGLFRSGVSLEGEILTLRHQGRTIWFK
ncbi:MAG: hypothetical protein WA624_24510 [Methylocella sp.]